jgi:hypothetical protein
MDAFTGSIMTVFWVMTPMTRAAAAEAWATDSGIAIGAWQAPAM